MSACCSLAEKIGGRRLVDLDKELRTQGHRSFRKLAEAFGAPGQKSAVERHKRQCLRLGQPFEVPEVKDPPEMPRAKVDAVPEVSQGQAGTVGTVEGYASRARAPEPPKPATSLPERVSHVVSQMAAGTWDSARDIPRCAASWGMAEGTLRNEVRVVFAARRVNRGDVTAIEEESLAFYAWQVEDLQAVLLDCVEPEEKVKIHARITEVRARMDAILIGTKTHAKVDVNLLGDPGFVEAAKRYVETVQGVLAAADAIAGRLSIPPALVGSVLSAAADLLSERLATATREPALLTEGSPVS